MKSPIYSISAAMILSFLFGSAGAQTILADWDQVWNYFHPLTGTLPQGSGPTTPHPVDTTPWFASEADFNTYSGPSFSTSGLGFEAGSGPGPLGYGAITYTTNTPNPEFVNLGTVLTLPNSGERYSGYFRTTFTVPDDGNFYLNPSINYLFDDGAFVYLDGELLLQVNVAQTAVDEYLVPALTSTNTESEIRTADLTLPPGSLTGSTPGLIPPVAGNATLVRSLDRLTPGLHTLAVSLHNTNPTSSDFALALQFNTEVTDCFISGSAETSTRDLKGTPAGPADDTISTQITIVPEGAVSATWVVTGPIGSSLVGFAGAYNTPVTLPGVPVAEFTSGQLVLEIADSGKPSCNTTVTVLPQRIIGLNALTSTPILTRGNLDSPGWTFDETAPAFTLNSPGDPEKLYPITSADIDVSGQSEDVEFTATLTINDSSSGNEEEDQFIAHLILDGDTNNPLNLIDRHDTQLRDGALTANELASGVGTFVKSLNQIIPAGVSSVRVVIQAVNTSDSENFTITNLGVNLSAPRLDAYARPIIYDNKGTADPGDDVFTSDFVITSANLGASTGWTSSAPPASGLYATSNPVTFGPFRPFQTPVTVTITDSLDSTKTVSIPLRLDDPTFTVSAPINITRMENGPGLDDDTVTFEVEITGTNGGPSWKTTSNNVTPTSGDFGMVTFSVPAPLVAGNLQIELADVSYRNVKQTISVNVPERYLIGQSSLSGQLEDIHTDLLIAPSARWQNNSLNRSITYGNNGGGAGNIVSEIIDLTNQGVTYFSALMRATETSTTSNFESSDQFGAELVYSVNGVQSRINLVANYDTGNGTSAITGANGAPNRFINGYSGTPGTDFQTQVVYTTNAENYDANRTRDEFNRSGLPTSASLSASFPLSGDIPAAADEVFLIITGVGASGNRGFTVSDVLFSTTPVTGDQDGDGIPTEYEAANGLNPDDPSDRDTDLDGDGQSNYAEFLAGTAANDPSSYLRITDYLLDGSIVSATWSSVPGKTYRVQFSVDLDNWTDLGFDFPAADAPADRTSSGDLNLTTIGGPTEAYFRVIVPE